MQKNTNLDQIIKEFADLKENVQFIRKYLTNNIMSRDEILNFFTQQDKDIQALQLAVAV